jgi:hypothetical protein
VLFDFNIYFSNGRRRISCINTPTVDVHNSHRWLALQLGLLVKESLLLIVNQQIMHLSDV